MVQLKTTKYLYNVEPTFFLNKMYEDVIHLKIELALKYKQELVKNARQFNMMSPEHDEIYTHYVDVCESIIFNRSLLDELSQD